MFVCLVDAVPVRRAGLRVSFAGHDELVPVSDGFQRAGGAGSVVPRLPRSPPRLRRQNGGYATPPPANRFVIPPPSNRVVIAISSSDDDAVPPLPPIPDSPVVSDADTVIYSSPEHSVPPVLDEALPVGPPSPAVSPVRMLFARHAPPAVVAANAAASAIRVDAHHAYNEAVDEGFDEEKAQREEAIAREAANDIFDAAVEEARNVRRIERRRRRDGRAAARRRVAQAQERRRLAREAAVNAARARPAVVPSPVRAAADGSPIREAPNPRSWLVWQSTGFYIGRRGELKIEGRYGPGAEIEWVFYDAAPPSVKRAALQLHGVRSRRDVYEAFGREYCQPLFCCNNCSSVYTNGVAAGAQLFYCNCAQHHTICRVCAARPGYLIACEDCHSVLYQ